MLFDGIYRGSSFFELLKIDHPHLMPSFAGIQDAGPEIPHGTTVLAFKFADGVVVGSELVRIVEQNATDPGLAGFVEERARELRRALD